MRGSNLFVDEKAERNGMDCNNKLTTATDKPEVQNLRNFFLPYPKLLFELVKDLPKQCIRLFYSVKIKRRCIISTISSY